MDPLAGLAFTSWQGWREEVIKSGLSPLIMSVVGLTSRRHQPAGGQASSQGRREGWASWPPSHRVELG